MELEKGFKQTEVGIIPEDWDVKQLAELGQCIIGLTYKPTDVKPDGLLVLRSSNIDNGRLKFVDNVFVDVEVPEKLIVRKDDILICVRNGSRNLIGKCALIDSTAVGMTFGAFMSIYRTKYGKYVFYQFQSDLIKRQINENIGATINQIINKDLNAFKIPFPRDPDEQHAINAALSDVDALLTAFEALIAKKRFIKQGVMQELLTGRRHLPGFNGDRDVINMAEYSSLKARIGWQGLTTAEYLTTGKYYLITGTDFIDGKVDWERCHFVEKNRYDQDKNIQIRVGDVLITKDGTIGKVAFIDKLPSDATLNSGVFVIRPKNNKYHPRYFYYVLSSRIFDDFLRQLQAGSTINHLYQKDFVNFNFPAPDYKEQSAIAEILSDMDAEIAALEARREKTRLLKQGMMQELLTGRIRLV